MKQVLKIIASFWWQILLLFLGLIIQVNANLQLPNYMSTIIDSGISKGDMGVVWSQGLQMLLVVLGGGAGMIIAGFFASRIGTGFAKKLRELIFRHILSFSISEIDNFNTASLITRTTNDITQIQQSLVMVLRMSLQAPIMAVGAISMALATAPSMSWIIGMIVAILFALVIIVMIIGLPKFRLIQQLTDRLNLVTRENLTGLRVVRAFSREQYEEDKFQEANRAVTKVNVFTQRLMVIMMPVVQLAISGSVLLIVWVGAHLIDTGDIAIGDMVAFIQYAMQVTMSFMFLAMAFIIVPRALVSLRRIKEVLDVDSSIKWKKDSLPSKTTSHISSAEDSASSLTGRTPKRGELAPTSSRSAATATRKDELAREAATGSEGAETAPVTDLVFSNVSFSYPHAEKPVLSNISFTAHAGQTTALIGSTGSGKSTIINLITRSYDPTSGTITLDGLDVKNHTQSQLTAKIGLVPQKAVLFSGTIKSNIKLGNQGATAKQVEQAAKIAEAYTFINKLDKKFDSHVAQGGKNFSGGQKQRLAIARAVCKNPSLYIFDDSFSALDYKTDLKVRQNLAKITDKAITLIVAQRIGSILHADQILVLENGKIVDRGTHKELLKSSRIYKEIAESQLSPEELK